MLEINTEHIWSSTSYPSLSSFLNCFASTLCRETKMVAQKKSVGILNQIV